MNICFIGRHRLKKNLLDNRLDAPILLHFAKQFDEVFLIFESDNGKPSATQYENLRLFVIPRRGGALSAIHFALRAVLIGLRLNRKYGIDVISASEPFGAGIAGVILKVLLKKKLMFQIQGELLALPDRSYSRFRRKVTYSVTRYVALAADRVRCVSRQIYQSALQSGIPGEKLAYISYRCDIETFNRERWVDKGQEVREQCGYNTENTVLVFVGALQTDKGVFELLDAVGLVAQKHPNIRLLLVGDGPCREELARIASLRGFQDKIVLAGFVGHDDIPGYLAAGDLFVFPSKHEGTPRAVIEAMAMELPVVATSVGGVPELVEPNKTGLLLEHGTADEIALAVERLLESPEDARNLGENARRLIVDKYSFKPNADLLVQAHLDILEISGSIRR